MNQTTQSYAARCRQWLAAGQNITVQTVVDTIEKFSRQLDQIDEQQQALADDLLETLDLLNDVLMQLELQAGVVLAASADVGVNLGTAVSADAAAVTENTAVVENAIAAPIFDPSPLQDYSDTPVAPLSAAEREAKLAELLASGLVSRGVPSTRKG